MPTRRKLTRPLRLTRTKTLERTDIAVYSPKERAEAKRQRLSPQQRQLLAQPAPRRLDGAELSKALATLAPQIAERLKDRRHWDDGEEVVLSARTPLIDGRGNIDAWLRYLSRVRGLPKASVFLLRGAEAKAPTIRAAIESAGQMTSR
ncbi:MAG: hypothetical protein KC486_24385, partial [Myxococcales bacterium]|nr:hypothetical protein [Myxococcales bacterium]